MITIHECYLVTCLCLIKNETREMLKELSSLNAKLEQPMKFIITRKCCSVAGCSPSGKVSTHPVLQFL